MSEQPPLRTAFSFGYAVLVFGGVFYALVLYPFQLDDLVKGALIGWATLAVNSVFSDQQSARIAKQMESASATGAAQALTTPQTVTVSSPADPNQPPAL